MLGGEVALEIRGLHRHGKGIREIARGTGSSRNTVRRYLRDESAGRYKPRAGRVTKLAPFQDYVVERLTSAAPERIPATVLLRELRERVRSTTLSGPSLPSDTTAKGATKADGVN